MRYTGFGKRELVNGERGAASSYTPIHRVSTETMPGPVLFYRVALCMLALPSLVKGNRAGHTYYECGRVGGRVCMRGGCAHIY